MATLLYHTGALGDFLTTLPAIALFRTITSEKMILLGNPKFGELAKRSGFIDHVLNIDSAAYSFLFKDTCNNEISDFFSNFSSAIFFTHENSQLLSHAKLQTHLRILHQNPFPTDCTHISEYHLSLVAEREIYKRFQYPLLSISRPAIYVNQLVQQETTIVAIAPGSGSQHKNWPFERFRSIATQLKKDNIAVYWISGEAEEHLSFDSEDLVFYNKDLLFLVDFFKQCTLFLGNDSGITHLAAASGCPVLALFGPSDPAIWAPRGSAVKIIHKVVCQPCHMKNPSPKRCEKICLDSIAVDEVLSSITKFLNEKIF